MSKSSEITSIEQAFLCPTNATHRQYEALRAYFIDKLPSQQAAEKFGYTSGSFRILCHQFRRNPQRQFFLPERTSRQRPEAKPPTKASRLQERVIAMRKQNFSVHDISRALAHEGEKLSSPSVWNILSDHGFAKLPRRRDDERPAGPKPTVAPVADARQFDLTTRQFRTDFGGLFLFVPMLASLKLDALLERAGLPGSQMVPTGCAVRSLLALKLFGNARHSHVMSSVLDQGLAFFAGLNAIPKRSFLTEYSCRIDPSCYPKLMQYWFDAMSNLGLERGVSFHLDFHTIPFHGEDALMEKHYVSKRSRRQKGVLAFLAQDADNHVFCYANADLRKDQQNDEILGFVDFWKHRTGRLPKELIFDSKLTTYGNLNALNRMGIGFITLRRRTSKLIEQIKNTPPSAWRQVELKSVSRAYRTPKVVDQLIDLHDYDNKLRQISITDLGHEEPTLLLTNQLKRSAPDLIETYAKRMLIENNISDGVDFFHMDALSSAVALKINCDLQLTLMGSSLYRMLGTRIGGAYATAESRHIFRDFIEASARVVVSEDAVDVHFGKRAHAPLLLAAGFDKINAVVPWWQDRRLRLHFG